MVEEAQTNEVDEALAQLVLVMEDVKDPRGRQGRRHLLASVLSIAVLGCLCGCDDAEALQDWAEKEEDWLTDYLELQWGVPSQDTFLRVLAAVDQSEFRWAFHRWVQNALPKAVAADQIAVDGKTARRSGDKSAEAKAVHMVSALACNAKVVLAQMPTASKSNELNAIRALLRILELKGSLVSIDAIACQTDIAERIVERGGDYLLCVKENQANLREQLVEAFDATSLKPTQNVDLLGPPEHEISTGSDAGHGRIETRTVTVIHAFEDWIDAATRLRWKGLQTLIRVDSKREHEGTGKLQMEKRYYISSRRLTASEANLHVRTHWEVENSLHYVLDVSFGEDGYRARKQNAAANFIVIRHFALNMIRSFEGDKLSVPRRRRLCDYKTDYREKLLSSVAS